MKAAKFFAIVFFVAHAIGYGQLLDSLALFKSAYRYQSLEDALKNPDSVRWLELRKQKLKEIPKEVFRFKNLQYLDLSRNNLKSLPDSIGALTNLQYFNACRNKLTSVNKEIGKLSNLVYLNLNNNDLESLPPQIGNLELLEVLDLWSNNLSDFPESMSRLKSLRVMDLRLIQINENTQKEIKSWLPRTTIHFEPTCNCKL